MSTSSILAKFEKTNQTKRLIKQLNEPKLDFKVSHLVGSSLSFVIASVFKTTEKPILLIAQNKEEAAFFTNDLELLMNSKNVFFYPSSYRKPYQIEKTDNANILLRAEVLNHINSRKKPIVVVTYPAALFEKVVTKKELNKNTLKVALNDVISIDFINEVLFEYKFKRVDFVTEPGEFSVRGGIVDVFSFSNNEPYRIEFFGDDVDSIRTFDIVTQLSLTELNKISIIPNVENKMLQENRESFLKYISDKTSIFIKDKELFNDTINALFINAETEFLKLSEEINYSKPIDLFCTSALLLQQLQSFSVAELQNTGYYTDHKKHIQFKIKPQPSFNKKFDLLIQNLHQNTKKGYTNYIACANKKQVQRFIDIFNDVAQEVNYKAIILPIYEGFIDDDSKTICYTDHQIFERYHKFHIKNGYAKKQAITIKELTRLQKGDYVTHIDHGIGRFAGLQKIEVEGKQQEAIKLMYGERDTLYVSIHSLHKITKYNGKDGKTPKIYKLGSGAWKKLKQKTKSRVKHIAFNLIKLYAKRRAQKGFQFSPDSYLQHELEASFIYEDTPDQFTATQDVKSDMESERPMDRLICGDVGFGKTEVAIRAAFKAVDNGKQVAILVPTTILAFQHHKTFTERLKEMPVTVDYMNRFKTAKQKTQILKNLATGKIDILIGTHQLAGEKVKFKDLGLLIVDEEQKFGVSVKDKLKTIKENVDTLTLTATPIPRTLQFSLMAARDLSTINTPPPNRYPIQTNVIRFNEETIRDAVLYEIQRGGQVFFVHNRIENIKEVAGMLQRLVPNAKIAIGHGQMKGKKLEQLMLAFMNNEFDVLVATTIIESGLDVPNANTIFINNANNFGLSDLHQMRGRVGRSNKKAFCYFITPPYSTMTDDGRKRIQALEIHSDLGSGFNIAMKDLEIRGAGDILGGEQSGFINEIGFTTYQKILNEAIEELKQNEFSELYKDQQKEEITVFVKDTQIDTDFELLFPDDYINNIAERLSLYSKLAELKIDTDLEKYKKDLEDRFGELPIQAIDLLASVQLKWIAANLGLERLIMKKGVLIGYFIADQSSKFYETQKFTTILQFVQKHPKQCKMKEKETKNGLRLLLSFNNITTVNKALEVLKLI